MVLPGPEAVVYLQKLVKFDLNGLPFGKSAYIDIDGVRCHVARGGYTGEDGFEVRTHPSNILKPTNLASDIYTPRAHNEDH